MRPLRAVILFTPTCPHWPKIFAAQDLDEVDRGLLPSCAGEYSGPGRFWSEGCSYKPEPEASDVAGLLEEAPGLYFLVRNPGTAPEFAELLDDPHLASCCFNTSTVIRWRDDTQDPFSRLPKELLMKIPCLLPTTSRQALRLTSTSMASVPLGSSFWRSRFEFPNELCHISLPQRLQAGAQADSMLVDWRQLCYRLLHSTGERRQNRRRIMNLNEKLVRVPLAEEDHIEEDA